MLEQQEHGYITLPSSATLNAMENSKFRSETKKGIRQTLLKSLNDKYNLNVKDFGQSWRDGRAFLKLIDNVLPQLKAEAQAKHLTTNRERLVLAFELAEKHLLITKLIDPEDMDVPNPDERSVMTYVSQFLPKDFIRRRSSLDTLDQESKTTSFQIPMQPPLKEETPIKDFIEDICMKKLSTENIDHYSRELNTLKPYFEKHRSTLDDKTQQLFKIVENSIINGKQISEWLNSAANLFLSYSIPTSGEQVEAQMRKHKEFFGYSPDFDINSLLLERLKYQYKDSIQLAKEWENAMENASEKWKRYDDATEELKNFLDAVEPKVNKEYEPNLTYEKLVQMVNEMKIFFNQRNRLIIEEFVSSYKEICSTLPESHQFSAKQTFNQLDSRYNDVIEKKAYKLLLKYEFELAERDFAKLWEAKNFENPALANYAELMRKASEAYFEKFNESILLEKALVNQLKLDKKLQDVTIISQTANTETMNLINNAENYLKSSSQDNLKNSLENNKIILKLMKLQVVRLRLLSEDPELALRDTLLDSRERLVQLIKELEIKQAELVKLIEEEEIKLKELEAKKKDATTISRKIEYDLSETTPPKRFAFYYTADDKMDLDESEMSKKSLSDQEKSLSLTRKIFNALTHSSSKHKARDSSLEREKDVFLKSNQPKDTANDKNYTKYEDMCHDDQIDDLRKNIYNLRASLGLEKWRSDKDQYTIHPMDLIADESMKREERLKDMEDANRNYLNAKTKDKKSKGKKSPTSKSPAPKSPKEKKRKEGHSFGRQSDNIFSSLSQDFEETSPKSQRSSAVGKVFRIRSKEKRPLQEDVNLDSKKGNKI
jgi:PREDICTED: similar to muscle-specific protein 300 CG33715-PD, isoform D